MPKIKPFLLSGGFALLFFLGVFCASLRAAPASLPTDGQPFELILVLDQTESITNQAAVMGRDVVAQYSSQITKIGVVAFGSSEVRSLLGGTNPAVANYGLTTQVSSAASLLQDAVDHPNDYSGTYPFYFDGGNEYGENGVDALNMALKIVTQSSGSTRKFIYFVTDGEDYSDHAAVIATVNAGLQRSDLVVWMSTPEGPGFAYLHDNYVTAFPLSDHVVHMPFGEVLDFGLSVYFVGNGYYGTGHGIVSGEMIYLEPGTYAIEAGANNPLWGDYQIPVQIDWSCGQAINRFGNFVGAAANDHISIVKQSDDSALITVTEPGLYGINVRASSSYYPGYEEWVWFDLWMDPIPTTPTANGIALVAGTDGVYSASNYGWTSSLSASLDDPEQAWGLEYAWQCIGAVDPVTRANIAVSNLAITANGSTASLTAAAYGEYTIRLTVTRSYQWNYLYKVVTYRVTLGHPPIIPSFDPATAYLMSLPAATDIFVAPANHRRALAGGVVLSATGSTVVVETPATLGVANSLVYAANQPCHYYLQLRNGTRRGARFDIAANTQSTTSPARAITTLTVNLDGDTLAGLAPGDEIQIIPHWTLGTFFSSDRGFPASSSESAIMGYVMTPAAGAGINLQPAARYYYYSGTANNGPAWRKEGFPGETRVEDTVLRAGVPVIVRNNQSTATTLRLSGYLHSGGHEIAVRTLQSGVQQDNSVTVLAAEHSFTLAKLGLPAAGVFSGSSTLYSSGPLPSSVDSLLLYSNAATGQNKTPEQYYYYTGNASGGPGWRKVGAPVSSIQSHIVSVAPNIGFVIRKAAATSPARANWRLVPDSVKYYNLDSDADFNLTPGTGSNSTVTLGWLAATGKTYQIESSGYLNSWTVPTAPVAGAGATVTRTLSHTDRYFRISTSALRKAALSGATSPTWWNGFADVTLPFALKFKATDQSDQTVSTATITADGCLALAGIPWMPEFFNTPYFGDMFNWCAEAGGDYTRPVFAPYHAENTAGTTGITVKSSLVVDGRPAFAVNWVDVGVGGQKNRFQAIIIDRTDLGGAASGNFDVEFNYGQLQTWGYAGLCDRNWNFHSFRQNSTWQSTDGYFPAGLRYKSSNPVYSVASPVLPGRHVFEYRDGMLQNPDPIMRPVIGVDEGSGTITSYYTPMDYGYATDEPESRLTSVQVQGNSITVGASANVQLYDYGYAITEAWYVYRFETNTVVGPFYPDPNTGGFTYNAPAPGSYEIMVYLGHPAGSGSGTPYNGAYMPAIHEVDGSTYIGVNFDY